jgi:hypothetical protein
MLSRWLDKFPFLKRPDQRPPRTTNRFYRDAM